MLAIMHVPSPTMEGGERTFVGREAIDHALAAEQHRAYCQLLADCGATVITLDVNRHLPDCAFVEDTAVVLDEIAVLTTMGASSRRAELPGIAAELRKYREVVPLKLPATLEGGDVVQAGKTLLVGQSSRTNGAGIAALEAIVRRHGYRVAPVKVHGCLHLKTACCALPDGRLHVNADWIDTQSLAGFDCVKVPREEPWGANVLAFGKNVIVSATHWRTARQISALGLTVHPIDLSEFAKAEAGVTCLSLLIA
jgi:dimethylargininase